MNRLDKRLVHPSGPRSRAVLAQYGAEVAGNKIQKAHASPSLVTGWDRLYIPKDWSAEGTR